MSMPLKLIVLACVILAIILIGDGYLRTRRAGRHTETLQAAVSAMSIQELARRVSECDPPEGRSGAVKHEAAYCAEVMRRVEAEPLQIVQPRPPSTVSPALRQ